MHDRATELRLSDHVERIADEHPPIDVATVDFTVRDPGALASRFGGVLDFMARVELEVDRNVLELAVLLPDPPPVDVRFFRDVWHPQEMRHGQILDRLQQRLGLRGAEPRPNEVGVKIRILGALGRIDALQDVSRMLYYLTGMSTERQAVLAYNLLYDGLLEMGEDAVARTAVGQIKRQEPGHYAFYQLSARGHWARLAAWQRWLVRRLRAVSYAPVGVNDEQQSAQFGGLMARLGITPRIDEFTRQISRVERELLFAHEQGMEVPPYVRRAFREAVERAGAVA